MTAFATVQDWARWLRPVAASVRNQPSDTDFRGRCMALAFTCRVDPADLTDDRARDLCRKAEFWPSVAEIEAIFAGVWKEQARSRAIENSGGAKLLGAVLRNAPTPEEVEAVRAKAAAFTAEMAASAAVHRPADSKPLPLAPADLLAVYEKSANPAMQFRAAQIRKVLEA